MTAVLEAPVESENTLLLDNLETEIDLKRVELERVKLELEERRKEFDKYKPGREISEQERKLSDEQKVKVVNASSHTEAIERQRQFDSVIVTGKFINRRHPGGVAKLTYAKYIQDQPKWWTFEDGKVYSIPRGFADQIKEHYYRPSFIHDEKEMHPNEVGSSIHSVDTSNKLYDFVPTSF